MAQGYNKKIIGDCLNTLQNNYVEIFPTCTLHAVFSSPTGFNYSSGLFGCQKNQFSPAFGTQIIPDAVIYPPGSLFRAPYIYNQTTNDVNFVSKSGEQVYFRDIDLQNWRKRPIYQPNIYNLFAQGPSISNSHCWSKLQSKNNPNDNYNNRMSYDFLDYSAPLTSDKVACTIKDFLVYAHSNGGLAADYLYTNVEQPFIAEDFYENSGENPPTTQYAANENIIPFCNVMPAYNELGEHLGDYIGYSFIHIFGRCTLVWPNDPLPKNPNSPLPSPPPVLPTLSFYSLETHLYMTGTTPELGSPLLNKKRFWVYNEDGTGSTISIFNPYFMMYLGPQNSNWQFNVNCVKFEDQTTETIPFNLSDMSVMVTA